jgi:AraC-like DNA-binding protein
VGHDGHVITALHPVRHLVRARNLADRRYFEPLTVVMLAREAGLLPEYFTREFGRVFGESPHQYLLTRRLERAAALLRATDWTISRICMDVGWSSPGSFGVTFQRVFGTTPTQTRRDAPPPAQHVRIPACVAKAYSRPPNRTFREASETTVS